MTFPLAFAIGFSVASIPGPMIVLISTETLRKGARAGLVTMTAPLLLDGLMMLPLGLLLQASLFSGKGVVVLGLAGAAFLAWLGIQSLSARAGEALKLKGQNAAPTAREREVSSFLKALLTHLTSPYPYLYWGTAGSSFVRQGYEAGGVPGAALFPLGFWAGASAFTLLVIYLITRGRKMLPERFEPHLHRVSGILLIASGVLLAVKVWQGSF